MGESHYDIVTVGGGLGGCSLAKVMAEHGKRVLVLEREQNFRDRVRGEFMTPWGVAEVRSLGIYELIRDNCGIDAQTSQLGFGPRDLPSTTPQQLPGLGFSHPEMQEVLLDAAKNGGAEVRRGVTVTGIKPGATPAVTFLDENGDDQEVNARLVVAADGRTSSARKWAGFEVKESPQPFYFAGLLLKGVAAPEDEVYLLFLPHVGACTAMTPVGRGRFRTYVAYGDSEGMRLQGEHNISNFLADARRAELVADYFHKAEPIGPLASFRCGDFWVEHPFKDGVALVGDAGSTSDPAFGQGLATTARDVRVLRDSLLANDDWDAAGHAFATEHDRYSQVIRRVSQWFRSLFLEQGVDADARRARAMPLIAQDETRVPDHLFSGPDLASDDSVRRRFFGES
ncbi:MAG TPA: NAD(P)/FAD-dependent oxidoreductase [Pyrinomonadaceae bacterium]|nr:NAD(P)/FAD-dependent oxidoreductase [Pyrinomonadaceae bacterium]